ncbi:MAG: hypothetical protein COA97_05040 [Flavobacteriales bacterium]|nr:MAG: hypothetical protein COA97_05040 [Flavobacteriales bacterium]
MYSLNFYLDKTYRVGTDSKVIKQHLFKKKVNQKHLNLRKTSIYLWCSMLGTKTKFRTQFRIEPLSWDIKKQRPKKAYEHYTTLNILLSRLMKKVEENIMAVQLKEMVTVEDIHEIIKQTVNDNLPKPKSQDFFSVLDIFLNEKFEDVNPNTKKKYQTFKKVLHDFKKEKGYILTFSNINEQFHKSFTRYLAEDKNLLNSTISKYWSSFSVLMNYSVKNGYTNNMEYKDFKKIKYETDVIFLEEYELEAIRTLDLSKNHGLNNVRWIFLYMCYTGQRYADIRGLTPSELQRTEDGLEWRLFQRKNNKPKMVTIPIIFEAEKILNMFINESESRNGRVLPVLSNQKMNKYIKEICKKAKITETIHQVKYRNKERVEINKPKYTFISCHSARRSFVSNSLMRGMNPETIMKITGHEDSSTMNLYKKIKSSFAMKEYRRVWSNGNENSTESNQDGGNISLK